ncbi:Poltergeist like 1 [Heracleum sosnowskyi]|uniref:Poltergeist like 1 n=1 Tax=Heracleum sosnowskyi TaxID=360622 RepID=A0AAD8GYS7_9APIA|nr:Poltergeist like 1 [Heracleum sosnowskyi]
MGSGFSQLFPCINPNRNEPEVNLTEPLDETLGHSFCYVRSSARFVSPTQSDRFISPSQSLRFSPSHDPVRSRPAGSHETGFKAISGASVSANTSTPRTVLQLENIYDDATDSVGNGVKSSIVNGFESTASFSSLPLQPLPRGGSEPASGFFMSGPIERGAMSGPIEPGGGGDGSRVPFSAPLGGMYVKRRRRKGINGIKKAFSRNFSTKNRPWVVPVRHKEECNSNVNGNEGLENVRRGECDDVQWALGKAGEDRVHVVVSEEHGWLFVGIYDGFNGPDAPEFLMGNLYKAVFRELEGLFWDCVESGNLEGEGNVDGLNVSVGEELGIGEDLGLGSGGDNGNVAVKKVTFEPDEIVVRRKRLWEFLAEEDPEDGLDLSGSERFAFSVDDALSVSNAGSGVSRRSLLLSKLKNGLSRGKDSGKLFSWRFGLEGKGGKGELEENVRVGEERSGGTRSGRKRKVGPVDHELVLRAMSRALETTEVAYLDMTHKVLDRYPELALMGSCLLVVLMRDEDVYVMNLGDSRAIVAHYESREGSSSKESKGPGDSESTAEDIVEESIDGSERAKEMPSEVSAEALKLTALQLSTDHSTSIEDEVIRIKNEHPDDKNCIVKDRVKGRLKVTRAFGAGFLKQPELNDALLEMFRNDYIGTAPYLSCSPSLCHHKLRMRDQFLVLSSDGLYQYLTNQEVVSYVECFIEKFPEGDPAQHLIEELLIRAAKKAGMDLHELLDIPQGDRRKYHDDVTVMVISLEGGRIWKSSGKYL